jgi:hypothetical protein
MCNQCDTNKYIAIEAVLSKHDEEAIGSLVTSIQRVRHLHRAVQGPYDNLVCEECSHMDINIDFHTDYPCLTIKALDGKQWNG